MFAGFYLAWWLCCDFNGEIKLNVFGKILKMKRFRTEIDIYFLLWPYDTFIFNKVDKECLIACASSIAAMTMVQFAQSKLDYLPENRKKKLI